MPSLRPERLVFLDETGMNLAMGMLYGWSKPGDPAVITRSARSDNISLVGAIALDGLRASMALDGGLDGDAFMVFLEQCLGPTLRAGDIVVMDNLSVHKMVKVKQMLASFGATPLYLPPYSPDLNPIEMTWSKVKSILRVVGARTRELFDQVLGKALRSITVEECHNWFRHSGYAVEST